MGQGESKQQDASPQKQKATEPKPKPEQPKPEPEQPKPESTRVQQPQIQQPEQYNAPLPGFEPTGDPELDDIERQVQIAYKELNDAIDELDKDIDKIIEECKKELEV